MYGSFNQPSGRLTVLGIETSCDETAAAVVICSADGRGWIASNIVRSQWEAHRAYGGVVPEIAARAHVACLDEIVDLALEKAQLKLRNVDAITATCGPGLIGGLIVGMTTAKALALAHNKPFVAVNHLEAHALTVGLTNDVRPPYMLLLVSGGHTQIVLVEAIGRYQRIGTTIDDALGEAFDKTAKLLGLGFPGGPAVERHAERGDAGRFRLPRPMLGRPQAQFSFAGLKTAVRRQAQRLAPLSDTDIADLCAGFEDAVCDCVDDRIRLAYSLVEAHASGARPPLVAAGGVASNLRLRAALRRLSAELGVTFHVPPSDLCADNAAMVAWAGGQSYLGGRCDPLDTVARARWPLDSTSDPVYGSGRHGPKV